MAEWKRASGSTRTREREKTKKRKKKEISGKRKETREGRLSGGTENRERRTFQGFLNFRSVQTLMAVFLLRKIRVRAPEAV